MKAGRRSCGPTPAGTRTVPASFNPFDVKLIFSSAIPSTLRYLQFFAVGVAPMARCENVCCISI
jgi:hypothetical protein